MRTSGGLTRRALLRACGALGFTAMSGVLARRPSEAAAPALGVHETVEAGLKRLFGGRPIKDGSAVIKLEIPLIAENGAAVPVAVDANLSMTPASYVRHIYIVADKNRIPIVTRVALTPEAGQASVAANIRLGEHGPVRAIVEQSDGTLLQVQRDVKVTVSGCGG